MMIIRIEKQQRPNGSRKYLLWLAAALDDDVNCSRSEMLSTSLMLMIALPVLLLLLSEFVAVELNDADAGGGEEQAVSSRTMLIRSVCSSAS